MDPLFAPGAVDPALGVTSKKALFAALAARAAKAYGLDEGAVLERLTERERLGVTGYGGGVAIPHARLDGLTQVVAVFARLSHGVDYGSDDGLPVDLVYMLLSPVDGGAAHLKALARASRLLRDPHCAAKLRSAASEDALVALLLPEEEDRDAA